MSILKSTNAGAKAYRLDLDFFINRGYTTNYDKTRLFYHGKHNMFITREISIENWGTLEGKERFYVSFDYTGKVFVDNIINLQLAEKVFEAKGTKEHIKAYKNLLKKKV